MADEVAVPEPGRVFGFVRERSSAWTRFCSCVGIRVSRFPFTRRNRVLRVRTDSKRTDADLCSRNDLRHMLVLFRNGILLRQVSHTCACPILPHRRLRGIVAGLGSFFLGA